jgi:hypothetical protein
MAARLNASVDGYDLHCGNKRRRLRWDVYLPASTGCGKSSVHAYSDSVVSDADAFRHAHGHANRHRNADGHANRHSNADGYAYRHRNADGYAYRNPGRA